MTKEAIQSAEIIKNKLNNFKPKIAIVLGSGLGDLADYIQNSTTICFYEFPGFHKPSVEGHMGQFVFGELEGVSVMCLQGRAHLYEGIDTDVIQTMIRTCHLLGCETMITTGATGSLNPDVTPGSLVVINDHINFQFVNPLVGKNDERFGARFVGMEDAYSEKMRKKLFSLGEDLKIPLTEGVYISTIGPSFETPAEIRAFQKWGADVVGMSVVPEVIVARHCGMEVAAIALVTNLAAGLHKGVLSHEETLRGAKLGAANMLKLVREFVKSY